MKAVSGKDLYTILERQAGLWFVLAAVTIAMKKLVFPPVTVPVHGNRTLKTGLQKSIMKDAGLTEMIFNPGICPKSHLTKASDTGRKSQCSWIHLSRAP